ncbi:MAG: 8-amino-7-oxononanoate synthase [Proteobacteria bacterium]|nr:8-amino-7-oxononanoate synthase [Pseudomonadota bacterium]
MQNFVNKLEKLKKQNLYRQPKLMERGDNENIISFCSNDYLGLSQNPEIKQAAIEAINQYGFGATSSRYINSNNKLHSALEKKLAELKNCDDAIIFGSGYLTAIGVIPALVGRNDLIIADKLIHSSLIDGAKLSGAKLLRFHHNDVQHCQELLNKNRQEGQQCLIITETIFSMDGDLGRVDELLELAAKFDALLISDSAHCLSIASPLDKNHHQRHLKLGTLSKAVGGYGGYVCADAMLIDYLRNFAKSAIYSTALPPSVLAGNLKALEIIEQDHKNGGQLAKQALANADYFSSLLKLDKAQSAIVPIIIGDAQKTVEIAQAVKKQGFLISAIRPPTVELGKSRLRITFSALHKKQDIEKLAAIIAKTL